LTDQATVRFELETGGPLIVNVSAATPIIVDIGEQLAWLGASWEASIYDTAPYYRSSQIKDSTETAHGYYRFDIRFLPSPVFADHAQAPCWQALFRNPSIAFDFPASGRPSEAPEKGMQMSWEIMIRLGDVTWATTFDNKFMLKGLSSMFYPVNPVGEMTMSWHFVSQGGRTHLPYNAGMDSCLGNEMLAGLDLSWLRSCRHFVGFAGEVQTTLDNYFRSGNTLSASSAGSLTDQTFSRVQRTTDMGL
jgi:hypothetical protein